MTIAERLFGADAQMVSDRAFALLLAANGIGALGTALVSPILGSLMGVFGVSADEIGLMVTAVTAPSVVLIPLSGALTDRIGRKPVLVVGLLCFGGGGTGIAFTTDFDLVLALRVLQGIGFAGIAPVIITCLGDLYSGDAETTAQGLRFGVTGLSQAVFPAAAGVAVGVAWQFPFLLYGLAIPVAIAITFGFESTLVRSDRPERGTGEHPSPSQFFQLLTNQRVFAYLLARAVVVLPFISFLTYNSFIIDQVYAGSAWQAGSVVALFSIVYATVASQTGRIMNTFDRPTTPLGVSSLLIGGGLGGFALSSSVLTALPWVLTMAIGTGVAFSLYRSVITDLAPSQSRGRLVSVSESGARLVATITPILVGSILSAAQSNVGTARALQWALVVSAALAVLVNVACLAIAAVSTPVTTGVST